MVHMSKQKTKQGYRLSLENNLIIYLKMDSYFMVISEYITQAAELSAQDMAAELLSLKCLKML